MAPHATAQYRDNDKNKFRSSIAMPDGENFEPCQRSLGFFLGVRRHSISIHERRSVTYYVLFLFYICTWWRGCGITIRFRETREAGGPTSIARFYPEKRRAKSKRRQNRRPRQFSLPTRFFLLRSAWLNSVHGGQLGIPSGWGRSRGVFILPSTFELSRLDTEELLRLVYT